MLRSKTEAAQWESAQVGLPSGGTRDGELCVLPGNPQTLVHALTDFTTQVFRSVDAGASWQATGFVDTVPWSPDVGCDPSGSGTLLLLRSFDAPVMRSEDGGATFGIFDDGLDSGALYPTEIAFTATQRTRALVATNKGVYAIDPNPPMFADGFESP